ncbi:hypothetical protein HYALB_00013090 [Hymenoscyphus albidus]|uniref:Mid2 domain-containing protein n=1 Tax=Hymenoscyphus albidus TaxID=595503 RepID=A0A9N9LWY3_9HELO|nr:hypothetical protein HYALB_00013090 [Hymenoscyphus albidus]
MVKLTNNDWADLTPGKPFVLQWAYEIEQKPNDYTYQQNVTIDLHLEPPILAGYYHDIWIAETSGADTNSIFGQSYNWDVPSNLPYGQICHFIISEAGFPASTTDIKISQLPTTRSKSPKTIQYCYDEAAHNCIDPPTSTETPPASLFSSAANSGSNSIADVSPTTLATQTIPNSIPPPTSIPTSLSTSQDPDLHTLSSGAKAGIAIGAVFGIIAFAILGFFLYKYGQRRALEKDNTTKYFKGWTAFGKSSGKGGANEEFVGGSGKAEMSAESAVKDGGRNELDGTPAPAYVERFPSVAGAGEHGGGNGGYVDSGKDGFRAELVGSMVWGDDIEAAPVATNGGKIEGVGGENEAQNVAESDKAGNGVSKEPNAATIDTSEETSSDH